MMKEPAWLACVWMWMTRINALWSLFERLSAATVIAGGSQQSSSFRTHDWPMAILWPDYDDHGVDLHIRDRGDFEEAERPAAYRRSKNGRVAVSRQQ